jgi:hypothetical protein
MQKTPVVALFPERLPVRPFPSILQTKEKVSTGIRMAHGICLSERENDGRSRRILEKQRFILHFRSWGAGVLMSAQLIKKYSGGYSPLPASLENPLWRTVNWGTTWNEYVAATSEKERSLEHTMIHWSQNRQTQGLAIALKKHARTNFPACGGFLI